MKRAYKKDFNRLIGLVTLSAVVFILSLNAHAVEYLYADRFYLFTSILQRFISSLVPFALGDLIYLLLVLYIISKIFVFVKKAFKGNLKRADRILIPVKTINFILLLYLIFKLSWGLNYSRPSVADQLNIHNEKYNNEQLISLAELFVKKINTLQHIDKPKLSINRLSSLAANSYVSLEKKNMLFEYHIESVKPVLISWAITKIGIEGYYNPLSGEANVNMMLPNVNLPFVTCHEIAHQLGIGREDEANLVGYLAAINSKDKFFQYSAAYAMLKSILFEIRIKVPEEYERLYSTINKKTIADMETDKDFWRKHNNQMFGYLDVAFDRFLKLNNQKKGTDSYQDIVLWLYNYHKKDL
jgi:hypothetical protein